jgi:hypothetical protein
VISVARSTPSRKYGNFGDVLEHHFFSVSHSSGAVIAQHKQNISAQWSSMNFRKEEARAVQRETADHSPLAVPVPCDVLKAVRLGFERKRTAQLQVLQKPTGQLLHYLLQLASVVLPQLQPCGDCSLV